MICIERVPLIDGSDLKLVLERSLSAVCRIVPTFPRLRTNPLGAVPKTSERRLPHLHPHLMTSVHSPRYVSGILWLLSMAASLVGCGERSSTETLSAESASISSPAKPLSDESKLEQLKSMAEKGDANAMYRLSRRYEDGNGVERNTALARSLLRKAADLDHPEAVYQLAEESGMVFAIPEFPLKGETVDEKITYAKAQYLEVIGLYTRASDLGVAKAHADLGYMLLTGLDGIARVNRIPLSKVPAEFRGSVSRALPWYEKAAVAGQGRAMVAMYRIYKEKKWGQQNAETAAVWMSKLNTVSDAGAVGEIGSFLYYGIWADKRTGVLEGDEDFKPEREWVNESKPFLERAAEASVINAQVLLSRIYLGGFNGYKNPSEATKWLQKASSAGDVWAQVTLGRLYMAGTGVFQDYSAAVKLFEQAAGSKEFNRTVWEAQYLLGVLNENGLGIRKDPVKAHAWYNIAVTNQYDEATAARKALTSKLTSDQLAEAQELAKNWKPGSNTLAGAPLERSTTGSSSGPRSSKSGTGTLFFVSSTGMAITNHHAVGGCGELRIEGRDGIAKLVTEDKVNDLALVQVPGEVKGSAPINANPGKLRQGEDIVVFGFPLNAVLSSGGNLTPGVVSALTGLGNNTNQIQITAPIQPGSSGSPVLNKKGEVIGVVAMKLSDSKLAKATGQVGQNVNFAVNGQTLKTFLDTNKVNYTSGAGFFAREKSMADLADEAKKWTAVIECWK